MDERAEKGTKLNIKENEIIKEPSEEVEIEKFAKEVLMEEKEEDNLSSVECCISSEEEEDSSIPIIKSSPDDLIEDVYKTGGISKGLESVKIKNDPIDLLSINVQQGSPLQKYIDDPVENDELYNSISNNKPTVTILNNIMKEIAEEAAFLKTWRRENFNLKDDMSEISERRIVMLNKLVDTIDKREKLLAKSSQGKIDFYGEGFKKIFEDFLMTVEKTFNNVSVPEQFKNIFFAQLAKSMDGFEKKAENIYYGKKKSK